MNRALRRANNIAATKEDKVIMMKQVDIDNMIFRCMQETKKIVNEEVVKALVASFALSLNDEFGFSTKRISRVLESTKKKYEAILSGHLSQEDIFGWCAENSIEID